MGLALWPKSCTGVGGSGCVVAIWPGVSMEVEQYTGQAPSFRLDVPLHSLLTKPSAPVPGLQPIGEPQRFPDPVFPQRPELLGPVVQDADWRPPEKRHWSAGQIYHAMRGWLFPTSVRA